MVPDVTVACPSSIDAVVLADVALTVVVAGVALQVAVATDSSTVSS